MTEFTHLLIGMALSSALFYFMHPLMPYAKKERAYWYKFWNKYL